MTIAENLTKVREQIAAACRESGRDPGSVRLVAVTKTHPPEMVLAAHRAGQLDMGENYVQEMRDKQPQVDAPVRWHFIGHLQRNKVKYLAPWVTMIHTVDSIKLAREIDKRAAQNQRVIEVLVQVNVAGEDAKSGCEPSEAEAIVRAVAELENLRLCGLMTIPPFWPAEKVRPFFVALREQRDKLQADTGIDLPELSMGMSADFPVAIAEGATLVRVGTAIFGERPQKA